MNGFDDTVARARAMGIERIAIPFGTPVEYSKNPTPFTSGEVVEEQLKLLRPVLDHVREQLIDAVRRICWWREHFPAPADSADGESTQAALLTEAWARDVVKAMEDFSCQLRWSQPTAEDDSPVC